MRRISRRVPDGPTEYSDTHLRQMFRDELPQAPGSPWFVRKVMNRLPEKRVGSRMALPEIVCYTLAVLGLACAWGYAFTTALTQDVTPWLLTLSGVLTLLTLFVIGIFAFPYLRRALA